jgi:norsolorinic acid ketoreductase
VSQPAESIAKVPLESVLEHFKINTLGPLALYQSTKALLAKSNNAKFVFITSLAASVDIQANFPFSNTAYSASKAAINIIGARLAVEEKDKISVLMLHPGAVDTDLLKEFLDHMGLKDYSEFGMPVLTVEESAKCVLTSVDGASAQNSGKFIDASTGDVIPW